VSLIVCALKSSVTCLANQPFLDLNQREVKDQVEESHELNSIPIEAKDIHPLILEGTEGIRTSLRCFGGPRFAQGHFGRNTKADLAPLFTSLPTTFPPHATPASNLQHQQPLQLSARESFARSTTEEERFNSW
jgi:hypothetical protein